MEAANRAVRERRQEILKQSSQFQGRLIERVMAGVLRDSKLQFDLAADPEEEKNLAQKHPQIVERLSAKHAAWAKTLAPLGKIPKVAKSDDRIGTGHGWTYAQK